RRTTPCAPPPAHLARTRIPTRSPRPATIRAPALETETAAVPLRFALSPASCQASSWRLSSLWQPDLPIRRGLPPLNFQQLSGHSLPGASSPTSSLTRSLESTLDCCHGPRGPRARLVEFDDTGFTPAACAKEVGE